MQRKARSTLTTASFLMIVTVFSTGHAVAEEISPVLIGWPWHVEIDAGRFHVDGEEVPSGCLQRLMTEPNRRDIIQSVYLTGSSVQGCMTDSGPGEEVSYSILSQHMDNIFQHENNVSQQGSKISRHENNIFVVEVCKSANNPEGEFCNELILELRARSYRVGDEVKEVLVLVKLGQK